MTEYKTIQLISLILFLYLSVVLSLVSCTSNQASQTESDSFHFLVLGDRTGGHIPGEFPKYVEEINRLHPDIVINVGDMIEGYTADEEELNKQWAEYKQIVEEVEAPVFFTPGNHDISPCDDCEGTMRKLYEQYIGQTNYTFTFKNCYFIIFDNSMWDSVDDLPKEKLSWMEQQLQNRPDEADHIFVFMHRPYWITKVAEDKPDVLHDLYKQYDVTAVFTGHYHYYASGMYDNIMYTLIGSSGAQIRETVRGKQFKNIENIPNFQHILWGYVNKDRVGLSPVKHGAILPWDFISLKRVEVFTELINDNSTIPHIEYNDAHPIMMEDYRVVLNNTHATKTFAADVVWRFEKNWDIEPVEFDLNLEPGATQTLTSKLMQQDSFYPLPELSFVFEDEDDNPIIIKKPLDFTRIMYCPFFEKAPILDGEVDTIWDNAVKVRDFGTSEGERTETDTTRFSFGYDKTTLYILVEAIDQKMEELKITGTERDEYVHNDDCAGFFFYPGVTDDVYQIYLNTHPNIFDIKYTTTPEPFKVTEDSVEWNSNTDVYVKRYNDKWIMEIAIHVDSLDVEQIQAGDKWQLNFRRKQQRNETTADWMPNIGVDYHNYGTLVFTK